jgi:hypothetical protein
MEIRDSVHNFIDLRDREKAIIDHPAFQRLRRIRRRAMADLVYPGAVHHRFEHSIGVCHIAGRIAEALLGPKQDQDRIYHIRMAGSASRYRARALFTCLVVTVERTSDSETREFYTDAFAKVGMNVQEAALRPLVYYAAGFPKMMYPIGNNVIRSGDVSGEYAFNIRMVRLFIWLDSLRERQFRRLDALHRRRLDR